MKDKKLRKCLAFIASVTLLFNLVTPVIHPVKAGENGESLSRNISVTEYTNKYITGNVGEPRKIERIIANVTTPKGIRKQFGTHYANSITGEFKLDVGNQPNGSTVQLLAVYRNPVGYQVVQGPLITLDKNEEKPPSVPAIKSLSEKSTEISGYSEPNALIRIWRNDQLLAEGTANQDGQFAIPIEKQPVGTVLSVSATNKNGSSETANITVKEEVSQKTIFLQVDPVYEYEDDVFIHTEANTTIEVRKNHEIVIIIGREEHKGKRYNLFHLDFDKEDEIFIRSYDDQGNSSEYVIRKVIDNIRPYVLGLSRTTDATGHIAMLTEPDSRIELTYNGKLLAQGTANQKGLFIFKCDPIPAPGEEVRARVIDQAGNVSEMIAIIIDVTPPAPPILKEPLYTTSTRIIGKAEPWSKVRITKNGILYKTVDLYGNDTFQLDANEFNSGDKLEFVTVDKAGHSSEPLVVNIIEPPVPNPPYVNEVTNLSNQITGTTEPNAVVELYRENQLLKTTIADDRGSFAFDIVPQREGTELSILIVRYGRISSPTKVVVKDVKAPEIFKVNEVSDRDIKVNGRAEPNVKIEVAAGEAVIGTGTSDTTGNFTIFIPMQKAGKSISLIATDLAGNKSPATVVVVKDETPPVIVSVAPVTEKTDKLKGQTEPGATVSLYKDGVHQTRSIADSSGIFVFYIGYLRATTKLVLYAEDAAGNTSGPIHVSIQDVTPPVQPSVNTVTNKSKEVSGRTEANATVTVTISGKTYSTKADTHGNYKVTIPVQNAGTNISLRASDSAGNSSAAKTTTVVRIAPNVPTVDPVRYNSTVVTGKTEKYVTVTVKIGTKIYTAKANAYGNFKVSVPKQPVGTKLHVNAKDSKGQVSETRIVTVVK